MTVHNSLTDERIAEILSGVPSPDDTTAAVARELWGLAVSSDPIESADFPAATAAGVAAFAAGEDPGLLVRRIQRVSAGLLPLVADHHAIACRLRDVTDEAVARACSALGFTGREHREAWLSYLCHDIKNGLNTLLNALWLVREHRGGGNTTRFIDLGERAARRIEATTSEVRKLQQKETSLPPVSTKNILEAAAAHTQTKQ